MRMLVLYIQPRIDLHVQTFVAALVGSICVNDHHVFYERILLKVCHIFRGQPTAKTQIFCFTFLNRKLFLKLMVD